MQFLGSVLFVLAGLSTAAAAPHHGRGATYDGGTLITADKNNHQIKIIGPDGRLLLVLGTGRPEKGPGKFATPEGVEVKGDTLWISDSGNDRIVKYRIRRKR